MAANGMQDGGGVGTYPKRPPAINYVNRFHLYITHENYCLR